MNVKQFPYASDNFGYLIYGKTDALAIDGGAVNDILSFVERTDLRLKWVTNTHGHGDHTTGTRQLLDASKADYLDYKTFKEGDEFEIEGEKIVVYRTPGHTADSVTFHLENILITGDTLFNGTVGNCFSGDLKGFYQSIKKLMALPDDTIVYAGHDYVNDSIAVAKRLEPDNPDIDRFLDKYNKAHVRSTLADERKINPYVRFNEKPIIAFLRKQGLAVGTEYERWESIMAID